MTANSACRMCGSRRPLRLWRCAACGHGNIYHAAIYAASIAAVLLLTACTPWPDLDFPHPAAPPDLEEST